MGRSPTLEPASRAELNAPSLNVRGARIARREEGACWSACHRRAAMPAGMSPSLRWSSDFGTATKEAPWTRSKCTAAARSPESHCGFSTPGGARRTELRIPAGFSRLCKRSRVPSAPGGRTRHATTRTRRDRSPWEGWPSQGSTAPDPGHRSSCSAIPLSWDLPRADSAKWCICRGNGQASESAHPNSMWISRFSSISGSSDSSALGLQELWGTGRP
jgi:hypothetical protein